MLEIIGPLQESRESPDSIAKEPERAELRSSTRGAQQGSERP
jgi:hypothetical protein